MATLFGTPGDDSRTVVNPGTFIFDGLAGRDTFFFGTSLRSSYTIVPFGEGSVQIDSISSASAGLHATLHGVEELVFDTGRDAVEVSQVSDGPPAPVALPGSAGDDVFAPAAGVFDIDGEAGIDIVVLGHARSAYALAKTATGHTLQSDTTGQRLVLSEVERIYFADNRVALDLDGHAGQAVKTLGAVFGSAAVAAHPEYIGIGLALLDGGMDEEALMQMALDVVLGPAAEPARVVALLYTHVVGVAPSAGDQAHFESLLLSGAHTPASLGLLAAGHELNLLNVDLIGLSQTGVDYMPG